MGMLSFLTKTVGFLKCLKYKMPKVPKIIVFYRF